MSVKKRTSLGFERAVSILSCLTIFGLLLSSSSTSYAQGERERGRRLARVIQTVPDVLSSQPLRPIGEAVEAVVPFPTPNNGESNGEYVDSRAIYKVGVTNISWRSREGKNYTALVYHPTSQPIAGTKFGVVIYSHGLGASPDEFSYLARTWASRGVVSVVLHHPETDASIWRGKVRPMASLKEAYHNYWSARDRAKAIRSAIDFVYSAHYDSGPMGADVDLEKIAVAGNDLGALGALLVAGQLPPDNGPSLRDERVAAVLALSPPVFCESAQGPEVYAGVTVPLMIVTGTKDDGIVGSTKAYQRRIPYDSVKYSDRYLVVLNGGDHRVYGHRRVNQQGEASFHETISMETADYLSAYLLNDFGVLSALREYGSTAALGNASVEKALVPVNYADYETQNVGVATSR